MYLDFIYYLLDYARKYFQEPNMFYTGTRFRVRSIEIYFYNKVLLDCLNTPDIDPIDKIDYAILDYEMSYKKATSKENKLIYSVAMHTMNVLSLKAQSLR